MLWLLILFLLSSQQPEKGVTKQMEFLCTQAGYERLQQAERRLSTGLYRQSSEEHSPNGLASDSSDGQGALDRPPCSPCCWCTSKPQNLAGF